MNNEGKTNEGKMNLGTLIIIFFLVIIILGMTLYIIMNETSSENSSGITLISGKKDTNDLVKLEKKIQINHKSAEFFDDYLYTLLPKNSANEFKRTITEFTDKDITKFVYWHIYHNSNIYSESKKVTKQEIDQIVYDYFRKKEYNLDLNVYNITQTSDTEYTFYWPET